MASRGDPCCTSGGSAGTCGERSSAKSIYIYIHRRKSQAGLVYSWSLLIHTCIGIQQRKYINYTIKSDWKWGPGNGIHGYHNIMVPKLLALCTQAACSCFCCCFGVQEVSHLHCARAPYSGPGLQNDQLEFNSAKCAFALMLSKLWLETLRRVLVVCCWCCGCCLCSCSGVFGWYLMYCNFTCFLVILYHVSLAFGNLHATWRARKVVHWCQTVKTTMGELVTHVCGLKQK